MRTIEHPLPPLPGLEDHLARWVADGVITDAQAEQIVAEEQAVAPPPAARPTSLVTEALGYVGGVLVVVASILLTARFWSDLAIGARLALVGAAAVLLLGVGAALPARPGTAGERLRSVSWVLSTGAVAFFMGLFAADVLDWRGADVALLVTGGASVYAAALWWRTHLVLQHVALFGALVGAAASSVAEIAPSGQDGDAMPGLGVMAVGITWLVLGRRGVLEPKRLALVLGGGGSVMGAAVTESTDWGRVLALVTVSALLALALRVGDLALLAVATVGMLLVLPNVLTTWFPGALAAPLVLLVCGALLVLVALRALRSHEPTRRPRGTRTP